MKGEYLSNQDSLKIETLLESIIGLLGLLPAPLRIEIKNSPPNFSQDLSNY